MGYIKKVTYIMKIADTSLYTPQNMKILSANRSVLKEMPYFFIYPINWEIPVPQKDIKKRAK